MRDDTCSIDGCEDPVKGQSLCSAHYQRARRRGLRPLREGLPRGWVNPRGYRVIWHASHPLARPNGRLLEHRAVLYDAIGAGPHMCHWCGITVEWVSTLKVDHVDGDTDNNVISNLVPSCNRCNTNRSPHCRRGETTPTAKLTEADVLAIRASPLGSIRLGRKYGVAHSTIHSVKIGRTWRHLLPPDDEITSSAS